jgi:PKD repeat protein
MPPPSGSPNQAPVASFTADQVTGEAPLLVRFDAGTSTDADGSIASYLWTFGDGATGSGATVEHVYEEPGLRTPTLSVTDDRGAEAVLSGSAIVVNSAPGNGTNTVWGVVWHDANASADRDAEESGVPSIPVFVDTDGDGTRDAGEQVVFTDTDGAYTLLGVEDGPRSIVQDLPIGWTNTVALEVAGARVTKLRSPFAGAPGAPVASPPHLVIGGGVAPDGAFPFQVALVFEPIADNEDAFTCGGTLIAASWVVTAAHCVDQRPAPLQILVGTDDLRGGGERIEIKRTIINPAYGSAAFVENDIALVELDSVLMHPRVELMTSPKLALANPGTIATAIGWGRTSSSGPISPVLKQLDMAIISNAECTTTLDDDVTDATICAGVRGQPEGLCSGDSGGPLLVPDALGWVQAGIVSFGVFTCVLPLAFARVSALVGFVQQTVPPEPSLAVTVDLGGGETVLVEFGDFR